MNQKALNWICSAVAHATHQNNRESVSGGSVSGSVSGGNGSDSSSGSISNSVDGSNSINNNDNYTSGSGDSNSSNDSVSNSDSGSSTNRRDSITTKSDLLELYCGNGNHTAAIAGTYTVVTLYCLQ